VRNATVTSRCARTFRFPPAASEFAADHPGSLSSSCASVLHSTSARRLPVDPPFASDLVVHNREFVSSEHTSHSSSSQRPGHWLLLGEPVGAPATQRLPLNAHLPLPLDRYRRLFEKGQHLPFPTFVRARARTPHRIVDQQRSRLHWWLAVAARSMRGGRISQAALTLLTKTPTSPKPTKTSGLANFYCLKDDKCPIPTTRHEYLAASVVIRLALELWRRLGHWSLRNTTDMWRSVLAGRESLITSTLLRSSAGQQI